MTPSAPRPPRCQWRSIARIAGPGAAIVAALVLWKTPALAQAINLDFGDGGTTSGRLIQLFALLTLLSLAPSILIMVTSFVRIVIVLSFLRSAMGTQTAPPNQVLISLALFLTFFIMAPTAQQAYREGIQPLIQNQITEAEAFDRSIKPFHAFMMRQVREQDLRLFFDLANLTPVATPEDTPLRILLPAFMISELRRAFEIGFLLFLPFMVIDMVIASVLMSMGMMMLPPAMISLPFKLIFFVLVDGWYLVVGSLVRSFGTT
jgi:flagellar biosynthetic protein FliP